MHRIPDIPQLPPNPSLPARLWLAIPDWVFRALGVVFFLGYVVARGGEYRYFPRVGPTILGFPFPRVLTDITFLLIAVSFAVRIAPRKRAMSAQRIILPIIAGFWPLMPFLILAALKIVGSPLASRLEATLSFGRISPLELQLGTLMLACGLALDVWSYAYLTRSLSIVAEARKLKTTGPYRFVRHPIYLGQFIAQAGFWLVLVHLQPFWVLFYLAFVVMQLYRSWIEEQVLEEAFGSQYLEWKNRTFWFF